MYDKFSKKGAKAVMSIGEGEHNAEYISHFEELNKKLGLDIELVNVREQVDFATSAGFLTSLPPVGVAQESIVESQIRMGEEYLRGLKEQYPCLANATITAKAGIATHSVISHAEAKNAALITVNFESDRDILSRGLSTAVSLMANSQVPVLAIPNQWKPENRKGLKILVADDLHDGSKGAIKTAFEISRKVKDVELVHFHATRFSPSELSFISQAMLEAATANQFPHQDLEENRLKKEYEDEARTKMNERVGQIKMLLETCGGKYTQVHAFGNPYEELQKVAEAEKPDIILFGHHHTFHTRPFAIGKVSYTSMVNFHVPIMVCS